METLEVVACWPVAKGRQKVLASSGSHYSEKQKLCGCSKASKRTVLCPLQDFRLSQSRVLAFATSILLNFPEPLRHKREPRALHTMPLAYLVRVA
jgi:hypothetical protein